MLDVSPRLAPIADIATVANLLEVDDLSVSYRIGLRRHVRAVAGVSLRLGRGRTLALIGESGSGKSTIARAICGLGPIEGGSVRVGGIEFSSAPDRAAAAGKAGVQIVFQDPGAALDPRWPVWRSVAEPRWHSHKRGPAARDHAVALLEHVGLHADLADRRPFALSGGQKQRVTIARALSTSPKLIILDEAVSALDVSVRNEILALLHDLQRTDGLTYLLISHDMGAVVQIATDVAVLYLGRLVETGEAAQVIGAPAHPYTQALIRAVPAIHRVETAAAPRLRGEIGSPEHPPTGCRFHPRCPLAVKTCAEATPQLGMIRGRDVACHRAEEAECVA
jgi:oligopeptide/dipeptide ABC transporter ATP-binding protein